MRSCGALLSQPLSSVVGMVSASRSSKSKRHFLCRACGASSGTWSGRCPSCDEWASVEEVHEAPRARHRAPATSQSLASFDGADSIPWPTGVSEFDRVLGGGFTPGSVTLLSGEPGIGKSTLTLQTAVSVAMSGAAVVLVTGEEAPAQVAARAHRLGPVPDSLAVLDCTSTEAVCEMMATVKPQLVIVDSVQTLRADSIDAGPGSATQLRESAAAVVAEAKRQGVSVILIGHVTKDGNLAGPRLLEHLVDTVLSFTGDRSDDLRFLRAVKHRFGPTTEVGVFEMEACGLQPVLDPSRRFLKDRTTGVSGSVVVSLVEGRRPVMVELQALVSRRGEQPTQLALQGIPTSRARLVLAVLERRLGLPLAGHDVFASLVGGGRSDDPGLDLALGLAVWSSLTDTVISSDVVACAEIGLAGELRAPAQIDRRLQEAYRLGFRQAIVPSSVSAGPTGLRLLCCSTVASAVDVLHPVLAA